MLEAPAARFKANSGVFALIAEDESGPRSSGTCC